VREAAAALELKLKDMLKPVYVAITGKPSGVPLFDAMAILGKDLCRARLRQARAALGEPERLQSARLDEHISPIDELAEELGIADES